MSLLKFLYLLTRKKRLNEQKFLVINLAKEHPSKEKDKFDSFLATGSKPIEFTSHSDTVSKNAFMELFEVDFIPNINHFWSIFKPISKQFKSV